MARPRKRLLQIVVEFYGGPRDGEQEFVARYQAHRIPLTLPSTPDSLEGFYDKDEFHSTEDSWRYQYRVRRGASRI